MVPVLGLSFQKMACISGSPELSHKMLGYLTGETTWTWPWHYQKMAEVIPASQHPSISSAGLSAWSVAGSGELASWPGFVYDSVYCRIVNKSPMPRWRGFPLIHAQEADGHYSHGITAIFLVFPDPGGQWWFHWFSCLQKDFFFLTTFISYKWALGLNNTSSSHETEFFYFASYGLLLERQRCHPTWNGFLLVKEGSLCCKPNKVRCTLWKTSHILWNFPRETCCAFLPVYTSAVTLNISLNNSHKPVLIHFYVCPSEIFLYTKSNLNLGRKNWNTLITEIYYFF